jgi:AcrR family transcriptional regulator
MTETLKKQQSYLSERCTGELNNKMNKRSGVTTKKRILDVASRIVSEYRYAGANMRMIAGAANIGVSSLYLYI